MTIMRNDITQSLRLLKHKHQFCCNEIVMGIIKQKKLTEMKTEGVNI